MTKRGPQDASRINLDEKYEVPYWSKALRADEQQLREAVKAVGDSAATFGQHFGT